MGPVTALVEVDRINTSNDKQMSVVIHMTEKESEGHTWC